jgi:septin family protein
MPITPRSESVQSFRLSDEDSSVAWETNSQAIQSSNGDEDDKLSELDLSQEREPQLVMPSISMPARRPFTARGRTMGRLKVMVAGKSAVGKTSLIKSIVQSCKDIVHVDQVPHTTPNQSLQTSRSTDYEPTKDFVETQASTRPYPLWWSDVESSRGLWRRKSFGEGILERNICFIDTPGSDSEVSRKRILQEIESLQLENVQMDKMSDNQLLNLFSGEGGTYVDAVLYLFEPGPYLIAEDEHKFIRELAARTNVIPLIGRAENRHAQELDAYRENIRDALSGIAADWYSMVDISVETTGFPILDATRTHANLEPFAISCAVVDDAETIDASLLMASDYLQPLVPSELTIFLDRFMSSSNIARMRHLSAKKFLHWRRTHLSTGTKLSEQNILRAPDSLSPISSPYIPTGTNSLSASQSKVLVPYSNSDYYRSASPSATSDFSTDRPPATGTSANALAQHNSQTTGSEPFRQIRLAKWAQDLQRSLANERKRYDNLYTQQPAEWHLEHEGAPAGDEKALISRHAEEPDLRPMPGRLGGEIAVIDPLGILSLGQIFRRQSFFMLRVAGGFGLVGTVAWWVLRNWAEVQEWVGGGSAGGMGGTPIAVPAPERGWWEGWAGM